LLPTEVTVTGVIADAVTETAVVSVRNAQARNNLKAMKLGEEVLFYHSQEGNCIMGKMKVIEESHQDKTTSDPSWVSVTFEPEESFDNPISLQKIKVLKDLENIGLIKQPRLAVMKLTISEYELILRLKDMH
jgi:predicted RNA-binding protein with PUA-like domain